MQNWRRFCLLTRLFQERFFENDTVAPGSGFQTNIYQVMGFLVATGWFISYFLLPPFLQLSVARSTDAVEWTVQSLRLFFTSYSFAVIGFVTVFEWDMLFPDRRDFLILGSFPIRTRELLAGKVAALGLFLLLLIAAMNVFPVLMMTALSILVPGLRGSGAQLVLGQIAATGGASLFAFLSVACLQGLLIGVVPPRLFQRISPWIQMFGMSAMILCLLLYPLYSILLRPAAEANKTWPWLFPPVWFAGVYNLFLPSRNPLFAEFGLHAVTILAGAAGLAVVTWLFSYRRHYSRTLESEEAQIRIEPWTVPAGLLTSAEERAIAEFSVKTMARSRKHRLFLATYASAGLAFGVLFAVAVRSGKLVLSEDGFRAFPFLVTFFVISGFRAVCQFPAELSANWLFRMTEARWAAVARGAVRKQALLGGLLPALALLLPLELFVWDWRSVAVHAVFQLLAGALLVEAMFWRFDKVPFTCSYFAGAVNLSLLAGLYLYGFTAYSFHLAQWEARIEGDAGAALATFGVAILLLALSWMRRGEAAEVRFDGEEPAIRTLDLT